MTRLVFGIVLALAACSKAQAAGPTIADALKAEHELASNVRALGKVGYPEPDKADRDERPVAISNFKCDQRECSYDVVVASSEGRRIIHRPGVLFCQDPKNAWVYCVS
jgi:hypothetical protein